MGNTKIAPASFAGGDTARVTKFYSNKAWIEGSAEQQLDHVSKFEGVSQIAVFPDLHPGKYGPVGCAILANRIFPQLIGSDIGCGMSLFKLDKPHASIKLEKAIPRLSCLEHANLDLYPDHPFSESLGTIGSGNHFCEFQTLVSSSDTKGNDNATFNKKAMFILVHSGSRGFGFDIFQRFFEVGKEGLDPNSAEARTYVKLHNQAVAWAKLNRQMIADRAAKAVGASAGLVCDSPHNLLELTPAGWLHRKGAAKADLPLIPLAGTRDSLSYVLKPLAGNDLSLASLAHGAGRKYDRAAMHGKIAKVKSSIEGLKRTSFKGRVVCDNKSLLIEEAPKAYKSVEHVLTDLVEAKLAIQVAALRPVLTYKVSNQEAKAKSEPDWKREQKKLRRSYV